MSYLIVGAGIWGCVMANRIATELDESVTVIDRREHIGGNCHSQVDAATGIECHCYGSHIFHTSLPEVWQFITRFTDFNAYRHKVLITHKGRVYAMPINLFTINALYGTSFTPTEAERFLSSEVARDAVEVPANLEEKAISFIGRPLYEAFIKNYTRKQWDREPRELPASIITRLPFRTCYNMDYFSDTWQGIPLDGYDALFRRLLEHPRITVRLQCDFAEERQQLASDTMVIYTGMPDALFDYQYGELEWRSLRFAWETVPVRDFQGTSVMNYADADVAYTRIHEFKHYHPERQEAYACDKTVICREYPEAWHPEREAYYPVNDERNTVLYGRYATLAEKTPRLLLGGRLGAYRYWDMDKAIGNALHVFDTRVRQQTLTA